MHYFICAGEASGDLHASRLIAALKAADPDAQFTFLGGDDMAAAAGSKPLIHYRDMAYMGFSEVIRHLPQVLGNLKNARRAMLAAKPDALILVDYPSFNLRLAETAHKHGIPVYYFISPKVWAWKEGRVKKIRRYVKRVLSILPFEVDFYKTRHGYDVDYVGSPSVNEVDEKMRRLPSVEEFIATHNLPAGRPLLAIVPGSRIGEIRNNLPIMDAVARRHPEFQAVIAGAPGIDATLYGKYSSLPVVRDATFTLEALSRAALVTSGTATLEAALIGTPQVVCYRANGSKLSYELFKRILKVDYVSLPNLIADRPVVPEMLLHHCNVDEVDARLTPLLTDAPDLLTDEVSIDAPDLSTDTSTRADRQNTHAEMSPAGTETPYASAGMRNARAEMLSGYADIRRRLTTLDAPATAGAIILADLRSK